MSMWEWVPVSTPDPDAPSISAETHRDRSEEVMHYVRGLYEYHGPDEACTICDA